MGIVGDEAQAPRQGIPPCRDSRYERRPSNTRCNFGAGVNRDARDGGLNALSTGERIVAALVLNRPEWLAQLGCTMAEAVDRIGLIRCSMLLQVQRDLAD